MKSMHPKGRDRSYETPVPGCLGRVVNLFDLTSGISRNKLLTNQPHYDVSSLSRSRSDVSRMTSPIVEEIEDKMIDSDMRSSSAKKLEGTPVKKLIAQEMSNSLESRHSSSNVVAKLMGLEALPQAHHLPDFGHGRRISKCHARNSYSEIPEGYWQQEDDFIHGEANREDHHHRQEQHKYKDIYEIWPPSFQTRNLKGVSPRNGRHNDLTNDKKMAFVRQKFIEAKRLSTDEKLRRTKEFKDALEVLSSNQDLFLKILQEPDSLLAGRFSGQQQIPPPSEAKRITVLKPSKLMSGSEKQFRKSPSREQANGKISHHYRVSPSVATMKVEECPTQPTRIVVLKPSPGRIQDVKALSSTPPLNLRQENFVGEPEDDDSREAREVAKEITQKMRENLAGHRRDETLLSSVFSNGYTGDESSFNKSEAEFLVGNLSDSEVMSPATRHSWDYVNQYGSPYSCSSFSHASYSPESSVCREAKKRLSERWAMVASNGTGGEQRHVRRSSSTLGEMLALSDVKKSEIFEVEDFKKEQESRASTSCFTGNTRDGEIESPRSLTRSKSLPVSSTASGQRLNVEAVDQKICKADELKGTLKQTTRSSFRGKVTSFFFSGIKKSSKTKIGRSANHDKAQLDSMETSTSCPQFEGPFDHNSKCNLSEEKHPPNKSGQGTSSNQGAPSVANPASALKLGETQDQLSPFLVLEPTLEDDGKAVKGSFSSIVPNELGKHFSLGKSNLIDKSPPIGSIPRTLSWEESCTETSTSNPPPKSSILSSRGEAEEEQEWLFLVRSLLSAASLQKVPNLSWHSPESLLDPSLRDKFSSEPSHSGKWTHLRSIRLLVFDCVNAALVEMTSPGSNASHQSEILADRVWARMKEWLKAGSLNGEASWVSLEEDDNNGDESCLVAERVTRKEVMGRGWDEERRGEVEMIVMKIQGEVLEEMIGEFVADC